jgi:hypothetical protein
VPSDEQIRRLLQRVFDSGEFLSPFGMRSLSKVHRDAPFRFGGREVRYEAAEAESKIKGGNSNWRGPVWFPVGFLMIESLRKLGAALDPELRLTLHRRAAEAPAELTLFELAEDLANRMIRLFVPDEGGQRPIYGRAERLQHDPHWKEHILFHEYFHGETGEGLGASHQTWTALVAALIDEWRR